MDNSLLTYSPKVSFVLLITVLPFKSTRTFVDTDELTSASIFIIAAPLGISKRSVGDKLLNPPIEFASITIFSN